MQSKTRLSLLLTQSKGVCPSSRLHLRLAMRQSIPSATLSPLPPYPTASSTKEPRESPATAPPSPEPVPLEPAELVEETDGMRATHVRPRTAPASPERPGTAYSTRSTIRQVEPSPDSLSDAPDSSKPAPGPSFEPFPPFNPSGSEDAVADDELYTHIPSTEPTASPGAVVGVLHHGCTPSGRSSPRKSRSNSPQKSRSQSPRKHMARTPSVPAHQETPSSAYSAVNSDTWEDPDTPSPVPREQQRQAYAPLKVRRPFAESNSEGEPAVGHGTHARIADYMRKTQTQQRSGKAKASEGEREKTQGTASVKRVVAPVPHIVQAMAQPNTASQTLSPLSAAQRDGQKEKEPLRHTSVSRRSEASGASVASKHSIFSTPGRDEMERKKPIIEEDEGPFAKATSMQDLEQKRRTVSEGTKDSGEKNERHGLCRMKCMVM